MLLGSQVLFKPKHYKVGHTGREREPADLAWIANGCAVLMFMTSGRKSAAKKKDHNYGQLHRWLKHWSNGYPLVGETAHGEVSFSFDEIDHIICLSIVGGENSYDKVDHEQVRLANRRGLDKVCVCATINDLTLLKLSKRVAGIRDILHFLFMIDQNDEPKTLEQSAELWDNWCYMHAKTYRDEFDGLWESRESLEESWHNARQLMLSAKTPQSHNFGEGMLAELSVADVIWFSVAEHSLLACLPAIGEYGPLTITSRKISGNINILLACHANTKAMVDAMHNETFKRLCEESDLMFVTAIEHETGLPLRIFMSSDSAVPGSTISRIVTDMRHMTLSGIKSRDVQPGFGAL